MDLQVDALTAAGAERIFTAKRSGAKADRKGLADALSHLRKGDVLTVWKTPGCLAGQGGPVGNVGGALGNQAEVSYLECNRVVRLVNRFKL